MFSNSLHTVFWLCAVGGTVFFVLKSLLSLVGVFDGHLDIPHAGGSHLDVHHDATDAAFKLFSINSLTGFFMMFGWIGLASLEQFKFGSSTSIFLALVAGGLSMLVISFIFKSALGLASHGGRFVIAELIGKTASVYEQIPASGTGVIQVVASGMTKEVNAVSESKREIASHRHVEVVRVVDGETVSVKEIQ